MESFGNEKVIISVGKDFPNAAGSELVESNSGICKEIVSSGAEKVNIGRIGEDIVRLSDEFRTNVMKDVSVPSVGMVFNTPEEAYDFYKHYSCKVGFGVTRRSSHNYYGFKYDVTFSCNKNRAALTGVNLEGFPLRNRGVVGTGCKARIVVRDRMLMGSWVIEEAILDHNHELFPDSVRLIRCHRSLPSFVKKQLAINEFAGLAQNKSINTIFTQAGGVTRCMFTERDMRNYISDIRRLNFEKGDAAALMKYFFEEQIRCPNFFYSCDVGDDGQLKSIFWADARSRSAFNYFGDVITFDSTYLTNRYKMPFAVFVGVNHHGQSILLGCALLANEMHETYVWLFEHFRACMSGRAPCAMITDQCPSICGAIAEVFPNTRHRLCLWHIMKKVPEKLGGVKDRSAILDRCSNIVYDCRTEVQFEKQWLDMLSKFEFGDSYKWFADLYEMRGMWVPVFVRSSFWAGMSTTQRSEGMNAFFDGYVNSRTTLRAFVQKYSLALQFKWTKEKEEDFRSNYREVRLVSEMKAEFIFAEHYTHRMFYLFQNEVKLLIGCSAHFSFADKGLQVFSVQDSSSKGRLYSVCYRSESGEYECECKMFEFRVIVCRHGLCVYRQVGFEGIPEKYILNRWRKNYVRSHVMYNLSLPRVFRENDLYEDLLKCAQQIMLELVEVGSRDKVLAKKMMIGLKDFSRNLFSGCTVDAPVVDDKLTFEGEEPSQVAVIKDPLVVKSKGRPRNRRHKPGYEKKGTKRRRKGNATEEVPIAEITHNRIEMEDPVAVAMSATELLTFLSHPK